MALPSTAGEKPQPSRIVRTSGFFRLPAITGGTPSARRTARRAPSSSSMRRSWLYFAMRSVRLAEPVLIWPAPRGHRQVRDERIFRFARAVRDDRRCSPRSAAICIASSVSVSVPIWFTLIRIELAMPFSMPCASRSVLVTNRSSPTSWILLAERLRQQLPALPIVFRHAVFNRDDRILPHPIGPELHHLLGGALALVGFLEDVLASCPCRRIRWPPGSSAMPI